MARGSIYIYFKEYIIKVHGKTVWKEILSHLPVKERKILDRRLKKSDWYPAPILNRVFRASDTIFGSGDLKSIIPVAEYIAEQDLSPVFDIFVNLKNPIFVVDNASSLWTRYFNTGHVKIEVADDVNRHYRLLLEDIADEDRVSGQAICTYGVPTWLKTAMIMGGAKTVTTIHTECRYKNASCCALEIRWE
jgi:hypothetical protein